MNRDHALLIATFAVLGVALGIQISHHSPVAFITAIVIVAVFVARIVIPAFQRRGRGP